VDDFQSQAPGQLRRARLIRGVHLHQLAEALADICARHGLDGGALSSGELSKIERGLRWVKPHQVIALAHFFRKSPGLICEWLLADKGLVRFKAGSDGKVRVELTGKR
jgi:transcriptional regulator with XRE-family HTH domain